MSADPGLLNHYTFTLELSAPAVIDFPAGNLMENVLDAVQAYDDRGRLFNGLKRENGKSCIAGISVCLEKFTSKRIPDQGLSPEPEKPPFWDESDDDRKRVKDISQAIDDKVEELRAQQESLWAACDKMIQSADKKEFSKSVRRLRSLNGKLGPLVEAPEIGEEPDRSIVQWRTGRMEERRGGEGRRIDKERRTLEGRRKDAVIYNLADRRSRLLVRRSSDCDRRSGIERRAG